jgi:1-acyl-sn-glycerol-3-phosphate acyltransferase
MAWATDPAAFDPLAVEKTMRSVGKLFGERRYFGLDARGFENVPRAPVMLVSNHSGGTTIPDVWGFAVAWYRHFGVERPLHIMTHEMIVGTAATGEFFARRGALRASIATARSAIERFGRDVLVMPGGDADAWRPHRRRYEVQFAGRMGYARLALELGVPIVPVANAGPHDTLWVLADGHEIARVLGLRKIARAEIWPIHFSVPWGLAIGPWPHLPLPVRFRYRVGEPITPSGDAHALDARVRGAVQTLLDDLASEKKADRRRSS